MIVRTPLIVNLVTVAAMIACGPRDPTRASAPTGPGAPPVVADATAAAAPTAEPRARMFLRAQIDALLAGDTDAVIASFAQNATVLAPLLRTRSTVSWFGIGDNFSSLQATQATITKLVAGGTSDAVWFYAEVETEYDLTDREPPGSYKESRRVVELVTASMGWRAVAASFTEPRPATAGNTNHEISDEATADGPLVRLINKGAFIDKLAPDALVIASDRGQLAIGGAARAAVTAWGLDKLVLFGGGIEVLGPTWGYVQANVDQPRADGEINRLIVQLYAVRAGSDWQVVLVEAIM